jgi:hypothetical protein
VTRKHFARIAWELRQARQEIDTHDLGGDAHFWSSTTWERAVFAVVNACAASNGGFDRERFLIAAGYRRRPDGSMYPMAAPR